MHDINTLLAAWESFYVIVGSSAAALTGLQFVVIALIAETARRTSSREFAAFATPNVVHFGGVLVVSSILSAPWPTLTGPDVAIVALGVLGVWYTFAVWRRARRQQGYQPVFEDWAFHVILPLAGYLGLVLSGIWLTSRPIGALFVTGGVEILLLIVGIHNAWDTVTFITLQHLEHQERKGSKAARD